MKLIRKTIALLVAAMICFTFIGNRSDKTDSEKEQQKNAAVNGTVNVLETVIECIEEMAEE
ncbi:MAG: hypothetical protein IKM25_02275 [Clostridia bacterium]|nr:hypothetical protein [Clostridia bacterium]